MSDFARQMLRPEPWSDLMMGNHALVRAMLEAGTQVVTTYPGSPTPEIADAILALPEAERPFHFEYSLNEKVALEHAFGASMNGHPSAVFFKSVGLNVVADSAVQLSLLELGGGMVVILGDDPGANSSQNEQDNRHFARMAAIPVFEPASPSEAYGMYLDAAKLARARHMPVFLRLTTHVCHQRELVHFGALPTEPADWTPRFEAHDGEFIPITAAVFPMKKRAFAKLAELEREGCTSRWNRIVASPQQPSRLGVLASGLAAASLQEVIEATGVAIDLFVMGLSYPLPRAALTTFLRAHEEVLVVEELDRIVELELKALAWDEGLRLRLHAKPDAYMMGEIGPREAQAILAATWPANVAAPAALPEREAPLRRIPLFCPGCGHRAAFFALREALPPDAITVADIGCHTMGAFDPFRIGQSLLCMGHSVPTAAGFAIHNPERKVVAFIGDSTFYHAGLPGIADAVFHDHDLTLVVMENGTTAMTGQQPNPSSPELPRRLPIERTLEGLGVSFVRKVDCYQHDKLVAAVREAMAHKGFAVVIASHPCMLKFTRGLRRKGKEPAMVMTVAPTATLEECARIVEFDCPSFVREPDGRLTIHPGLCVGDGSCRAASRDGVLQLAKREEVKP